MIAFSLLKSSNGKPHNIHSCNSYYVLKQFNNEYCCDIGTFYSIIIFYHFYNIYFLNDIVNAPIYDK